MRMGTRHPSPFRRPASARCCALPLLHRHQEQTAASPLLMHHAEQRSDRHCTRLGALAENLRKFDSKQPTQKKLKVRKTRTLARSPGRLLGQVIALHLILSHPSQHPLHTARQASVAGPFPRPQFTTSQTFCVSGAIPRGQEAKKAFHLILEAAASAQRIAVVKTARLLQPLYFPSARPSVQSGANAASIEASADSGSLLPCPGDAVMKKKQNSECPIRPTMAVGG